MAKYTFNITNEITNQTTQMSGYADTEELAREDAKKRYLDFELDSVPADKVTVGACVSRGDGNGAYYECEGCSA